MVFSGLMGMEGLVGSSTEGGGDTLLLSSGCRSQRELFGSGHVRGAEEGSSRWLKMARTDQKSPNESGSGSDHSLLLPYGQHHMLSFSSARHDPLGLGNHGVAYGGQSQTMHGVLGGDRGPFTPSQWMELEHHAMIYKYIEANAPIPSSLLISLRRNQNPPLYSGYSLGPLAPTTYGWGSLQLGFSGSSDPEPGRCRRTDGKKWRCSRDAVVDQKYCERHMNRGRHRSRKPVEGHNGQAKTMPTIASSPAVNAASTIVASTGLSIADKQLKDFGTGSSHQPVVHFNRTLPNKEALSIPMNIKLQNAVPLVSKQYDPFDISLLNSSRTSYMKNRNNSPSSDIYEKEAHPQLLHHFMDNMPKKQSDRLSATWADTEQIHSERTQLSISIPNSDASSAYSFVQELVSPAPLRSSLELDPIPLGLSVDTILDSGNQGQGNWASISWGSSMGGPLAEVLNNTNNKSNYVNSSLNLVQSWNLSPEFDSSPTGVLQKTAFRSHSSSAGSSPRADNFKVQENVGSLCDELL